MKTFVIGTQDNIFTIRAEGIVFEDDRIGFVMAHQAVAEFKEWEYWYEETSEYEEKKEACCSCK